MEPAILPVTVYQKPASLTISPDSASLTVDETTTLRASVMDANGHDIRVAERGKGGLAVYWETSDSEVVTVDGASATATVTGVAAGTANDHGALGHYPHWYGHDKGDGLIGSKEDSAGSREV